MAVVNSVSRCSRSAPIHALWRSIVTGERDIGEDRQTFRKEGNDAEPGTAMAIQRQALRRTPNVAQDRVRSRSRPCRQRLKAPSELSEHHRVNA